MAILSVGLPHAPRVVRSRDDLLQAIDERISAMEALETPANLLVLPIDPVLANEIHSRPGFSEATEQERGFLGTYRGSLVFIGPPRWPDGCALLCSLSRWLRVDVVPPTGPSHPRNDRFTADIRIPTDAEIQADIANPTVVAGGLPLEGDDLRHAAQTRLRLGVTEEIVITETDTNVLSTFRLERTDGHVY